jgi:hypothetical protein
MAMIVVVLAVLAVVLTRGGGGGEVEAGGSMAGPAGRAAARGLVVDTFSGGEGSPIETTESGQPWSVVAGDWAVRGGDASVTPWPDAPTSAIVVDPRQPGGTFTVTFSRVVPGAGVVFRYGGPRNFWYLTAAPQSATWRVVRVVDGVQTEVDTLGVVPVADGTTIAVDGQRRRTIVDAVLAGNARVGLIASGPRSDQVRWANVVLTGSRSAPVGEQPPPAGTGGFPELPGT